MQLKTGNYFKQITIIGLVLLIFVASFPMEAHAAPSKTKAKKKYTVTIKNANSDTVIKKGKKLKLKCTATSKSGKRIKVKYRSSNKKVISVSRKGVIKGKKKGKSKITAYVTVKGKIRARKTITVRVGKPVTSIRLTGYNYLRAGKTSKLKAKVSSKSATNKKVIWKSSNPAVASVSSKGVVTGNGNGRTTITATAADGSGVTSSVIVYSHRYTKNDTKWIAHRGLHENETENTAAAFEAAGRAGFWGCECDIYETKHDVPKPVLDENGDPVKDENGEPVTEEDFEIVIDHDGNFKRVFGVEKRPDELTAEGIRQEERLRDVCFFDEYLEICKNSKMIPIIEIKRLSDQGLERMVDMVHKEGLLSKDKCQFISFNPVMTEKARDIAKNKYKTDIYIGYLITGDNIDLQVEYAVKKSFDGINIHHGAINEQIDNMCKDRLNIGTWTYGDSAGFYRALYEHVVLKKYNIDTVTTDGALFK